jgi:hypothetical protein
MKSNKPLFILSILISLSACRKEEVKKVEHRYVHIYDEKTGQPLEGVKAKDPDIGTLHGISDANGLIDIIVTPNSWQNFYFSKPGYTSSGSFNGVSTLPQTINLKAYGYIKIIFHNGTSVPTNWCWLFEPMGLYPYYGSDMSGPDKTIYQPCSDGSSVTYKYSFDSIPDWTYPNYYQNTVTANSHDTTTLNITY